MSSGACALAAALEHDADSGRSPSAVSASRDLGLVEPARDLAQFQPVGAHALDRAQDFLLVGQRDQEATAIPVAFVAQFVAVGRRAAPLAITNFSTLLLDHSARSGRGHIGRSMTTRSQYFVRALG